MRVKPIFGRVPGIRRYPQYPPDRPARTPLPASTGLAVGGRRHSTPAGAALAGSRGLRPGRTVWRPRASPGQSPQPGARVESSWTTPTPWRPDPAPAGRDIRGEGLPAAQKGQPESPLGTAQRRVSAHLGSHHRRYRVRTGRSASGAAPPSMLPRPTWGLGGPGLPGLPPAAPWGRAAPFGHPPSDCRSARGGLRAPVTSWGPALLPPDGPDQGGLPCRRPPPRAAFLRPPCLGLALSGGRWKPAVMVRLHQAPAGRPVDGRGDGSV